MPPAPCPRFSCQVCISPCRSLALPFLSCPPTSSKQVTPGRGAAGPGSCSTPRDAEWSHRKDAGKAKRSRSIPSRSPAPQLHGRRRANTLPCSRLSHRGRRILQLGQMNSRCWCFQRHRHEDQHRRKLVIPGTCSSFNFGGDFAACQLERAVKNRSWPSRRASARSLALQRLSPAGIRPVLPLQSVHSWINGGSQEGQSTLRSWTQVLGLGLRAASCLQDTECCSSSARAVWRQPRCLGDRCCYLGQCSKK